MRSDAELLRSAESGAFRELYDRHAERIYRFKIIGPDSLGEYVPTPGVG